MDLHLCIPERSQPHHGIMQQFRDQFSVDASQCRGSELDDGPDFFDGFPSLMNRLGGDLVPSKLGECLFNVETTDYLELLSNRFAKSEIKAWFFL